MKIAALYWPTSSVGGINTELRALRAEAERRGDTFHVFRSGKHKNIKAQVFPERKLIRGGDTFITIDGEASHHPDQLHDTINTLFKYDQIYLAYLCPHPTKDYGDKPLFLTLLELLHRALRPITARVTDGYWNDYKEWGEATLKLCKAATYVHRASGDFWEDNNKVRYCPAPFDPDTAYDGVKRERDLTVYISQWKAIKGIHKLLPEIPNIKGHVELYSNGILYYQLRTSAAWKAAVGKDLFKGFDGAGKATFFGYIPLDEVPVVLRRATFMVDLMGIGKPKNQTYIDGAHNLTAIEAAWYGCCPILHSRACNVVPLDIALFAGSARQVVSLINSKEGKAYALDPARQARAKEWADSFHVKKSYNRIVLGAQS